MLFETYAGLLKAFPNSCNQLFGTPLTPDNSLWLSVNENAYPCLLFSVQQNDFRNDIELKSVSVLFSRDCVVETVEGTKVSGIYTLIRLNESDPDVVRVMLRLLQEVFQKDRSKYSNKEISERVLEISDIFKKVEESTEDVVGLWGELYIILCANDLNVAVQSWCYDKKARYDYVVNDFALEAKTTLLSKRKHRFSLKQLRPDGNFCVYIASLVVAELNAGKAVADLMDEIYIKIVDDNLRAKFMFQCFVKGGQHIYRSGLKLGVLPNNFSLKIFNSLDIPVPIVDPKSLIDNVKFDVDLSERKSVSKGELDTVLSFGVK